MADYACIKNGIVANTIYLEQEDLEILELVKTEHEYDEIINCDLVRIIVGFSYDGTNFYEEDGKPAMTWEEFYNGPSSEEVIIPNEEEVAHLDELMSEVASNNQNI
jgi:hypothetical protein